jgi:hypothetical protein
MLHTLLALFITLHGLVHLWYFTLSQGLVTFQPEMGWSGQSWALSGLLGTTPLRTLAAGLYLLSALVFVAGGICLFLQAEWWRPVVIGSAMLSAVTILLFWDGSMQMLVEKGLLGLAINIGLVVLLSQRWPVREL